MDWNMLYSDVIPPTWEQVTEYISSPLWAGFNERIQSAYQVTPCMEHSRCSMQAGWNVKYKKSGKSLCTLYPMEGYFIALVVVGSYELTEAELLMPLCTGYVQTVFKKTKVGWARGIYSEKIMLIPIFRCPFAIKKYMALSFQFCYSS